MGQRADFENPVACGNKQENSGFWVRVSNPWAGKSFGFVQVPRIGQEVGP